MTSIFERLKLAYKVFKNPEGTDTFVEQAQQRKSLNSLRDLSYVNYESHPSHDLNMDDLNHLDYCHSCGTHPGESKILRPCVGDIFKEVAEGGGFHL